MWAFVWSPVRFFEVSLQRPPRWFLALIAPALCGLLNMAAVLILAEKNHTMLDGTLAGAGVAAASFHAARLSAVLTIAGYPVYFALTAMILASLDVLLKDSGRQERLIEFAGLAFFAFLPSCLFMLGVAIFWTPPPFDAGASGSLLDLQAAAIKHVSAMRGDPWPLTAAVFYYVCLAWCAALLGVILRVAGEFSVRAAGAAALAIFAGFSGFWR